MRHPEKKHKANKVKFAMASFLNEVAATSTLKTLRTDFQDIFEIIMLSDEADDSEFREKAVLILQFTKLFEKYISNIPWEILDDVTKNMKDDVSLKILSGHESL